MMKQIQEQTALNPLHSHWRLADDRNVLYLSPTGETDAEKTVELSPEQAGRIREITAITSSLLITLLIEKQVTVTNGAIVIHTQRLKSDPGGNLLS